MSLRYKWNILLIEAHEIPKLTRTILTKWKPLLISYDTETTGLNIGLDKPFYVSLAFLDEQGIPRACGIDIEKADPKQLKDLMNAVYYQSYKEGLIGHNLPFDLNMAANVGCPVTHKNLVDTMSIIRLATDAIQTKYGGAPLGLKEFTARYITHEATVYEKYLKIEQRKIADKLNAQFNQSLPPKSREIWKDLTAKAKHPDAEDLPEPFKTLYETWYESLPRAVKENMKSMKVESSNIPYNMIDRKILATYAVYDAIYTYEIYDLLIPMIKLRDQEKILELEKKLTYPLYMISREGFKINTDYVYEKKVVVKNYLLKRQQDLANLLEEDITHNQTIALLRILRTKFGLTNLNSTNEEAFEVALNYLYEEHPKHPAIAVIETVAELRGITKFYGTYLKRFYRACIAGKEYMYSTLNPSGTVTGRFTSDAQQFPKEPLLDSQGTELLHARKLISVHPGFDMLMIDYNQIELRYTALYTILLGHPDTNMCQAFMPYLCRHYDTGELYDYNNPSHIKRWNEIQPNGRSAWILPSGIPWTKTDLHGKTASEAYPNIRIYRPDADLTHPSPDMYTKEFKKVRGEVGKRANFACNYGAKAARLKAMFYGISMEEAKRIYQAYRDTFPGVIIFHQWCYDTINQQGYGENLYGRKYYNTTGHQFSNAAVQGSAADLLKIKVIELFEFLEPYKTKMIMNVHDEVLFKLAKDEHFLVPKLVEIMENVEGTKIPIVAEVEISSTTWAEKKGFKYELT